MTVKFTPRLVDLTYEAVLSCYWFKPSLRKFLRSAHISESFLATWGSGETKREFLDRLFLLLQGSEKNKQVLGQMALSVSEYTSFPDLRNHENASQMIEKASRAVAELKQYLSIQNIEIRDERERDVARAKAHEERQVIQRARTDKVKLQKRLDDLASAIGTQQGGYDFEVWFFDFLDFFEIQNRRPYRSSGRQMDGSLTIDGTTYIVELKFEGNPVGSPDIDVLRTKVADKADMTMGIMVSISGYTSGAIRGASQRGTTTLLFDHSHIYFCLLTETTFEKLMSRVRRHASQTAEAFLSVEKFDG